jgi:hypothetical protein
MSGSTETVEGSETYGEAWAATGYGQKQDTESDTARSK